MNRFEPEADRYIFSVYCGLVHNKLQKVKDGLELLAAKGRVPADAVAYYNGADHPEDFVAELAESRLLKGLNEEVEEEAEFLEQFGYLRKGLDEIRDFKAFLSENGQLEWFRFAARSAVRLSDSLPAIVAANKAETLVLPIGINDDTLFIVQPGSGIEPAYTVRMSKELEYVDRVYTNTAQDLLEWILLDLRKHVEDRYERYDYENF